MTALNLTILLAFLVMSCELTDVLLQVDLLG